MHFSKKTSLTILSLIIFLIGAYLFFNPNSPAPSAPSPSPIPSFATTNLPTTLPGTFKVTKVIDGDTIEIEGGQRVRYIGVDTPETVDPRRPVGCFGKEASDKNKELVEGKSVRLEKDISETDKYDRLLRYVYVDNIFVNDFLVKEGYAKSSSYPPDIKYQEIFKQSETEARSQQKGLWGPECVKIN